jgi:ankyrin repeat protein
MRTPLSLTPQTALVLSCRSGQAETMLHLLRAKASVEKSDVYDRTPISIAAAGGYTNLVSMLLEKGAKVAELSEDFISFSPTHSEDVLSHQPTLKMSFHTNPL